jgi:anti-sigma-K factor RskA
VSDIHALSGAYAVDALDDSERSEFEEHLAECAECRAEVASFRETAVKLAEQESALPPASLRDSVLADISQVRPLPPESPARQVEPAADSKSTPIEVVRRRRLGRMLVAAAAAVVLLAVGVVAWHPWRNETTTIAEQIRNAPDAVTVTEVLPNGGTLTLVRSPSLRRAVMTGEHVPAPPAGKTYQLWLQQPGVGLVSAGLMPDADQPTVLAGDVTTARAAAVSVEPASGSPKPTSKPVALFPLVG